MSGGGGKGGSQTSSTQIPKWIQEPAQRAIARGEDIAQIGYVPYAGPSVAALSTPQISAMQNTASAANAFGLGGGNPLAGMPAPQQFAGGVQGYSSLPILEESQAYLEQNRPGQFNYMNDFFIDPVSGVPAAPLQSAPVRPVYAGPGIRAQDRR